VHVLLAIGQSRVMFRASALAAVVELGLLFPALKFGGLEGVAIIITLAAICQYPIFLQNMKKHFSITTSSLFTRLTPALVAMAITFVVVKGGALYFGVEMSVMTFVAKICITTILYLMVYGLYTKWVLFRELKEVLFSN